MIGADNRPIVQWHQGCAKCGLGLVRVWHMPDVGSIPKPEHLHVNCAACGYTWHEATKDAKKLPPPADDSIGVNVLKFTPPRRDH